MEQIWLNLSNFFNIYGARIISFLITIVIGILIIRIIKKSLIKLFAKRHIDGIVANFVTSLLYVILITLLVITLFDLFEISTTPFVTVLGAAGLALALSLKDSLSNIASGLVIIATKPFKQEDYVKIGDLEGVVKKINFFTTEIFTYDNKRIIMPNNKVAKSDITNYTSLDTRLMELNFTVPFGTSVEKVKEVVSALFLGNENILTQPEPAVRLYEHTPSTMIYRARLWVNTVFYWPIYFELQEKLYNVLKDSLLVIKEKKIDINFIKKM